jgi:hypothetical protein
LAQPANSRDPGRPPASAGRRLGVALIAPDLALAVAAVTLFYCLFLFEGYRTFFRDADTGWHIRNGERLVSGGGLPRSDPYSFSKPDEPWFAWEWASDAVMGWTHARAGLRGVTLLFALVISLSVWLWVRLHWALGGHFLLACALLPPMLTTTSLHWLARPHIFSWIFLLSAVWVCEKAPVRFRPAHAAAIAVASACWANMHGSFFLAPLIALLYALGLWIRPLLWDSDFFLDRQRSGWLVRAAAISAAATLINPYGWRLHLHLFSYLTNSDLLARIAEFQSFNFHAEGAFQVWLTLALCWLGVVLALAARHPGRALVSLFFIAVAMRSARGLPVAALLLLPLLNASLTSVLHQWTGLRQTARARLDTFLAYGARLRALDARFHGAFLVPQLILVAALALALPVFAASTGFSAEEFPVAAAPHIALLPPQARIFSSDKFGGYLIYRFNGARKVFFDGRSDFYGPLFMKRYLRLAEARPGWQDIWNDYNFSHALTPRDAAITATLDAAGWRRLHADSTSVLFEAPVKE